jgi:uncharacterized protein YciI
MPFFTVTMTHPDGEGWGRPAAAHVDHLRGPVASGTLRASGPLFDGPLRAGFLIVQAATREDVEAIVRDDPFTREGLVVDLTIRRWDPLFGAFAAESSGNLAGVEPIEG